MTKSNAKNGFSVTAYQGDAKTLLAFNVSKRPKNLAGFTVQCKPDGKPPYFLFNTLKFKEPARHNQVQTEPGNSSINAPFHKFRWLHVPGSFHQGTKPVFGPYTYTVTPRFFDNNQSMLPLDQDLSVSVTIDVRPFVLEDLELGFARGFTQSQAFVHHFGNKAPLRPKGKDLIFDTSTIAGKSPEGKDYTFEQAYEWMGYTARKKIFEMLNEVLDNKNLRLDVFAYDLNEPDMMSILVKLAAQGRVRIILDNAALHHNKEGSKPEDRFETLFDLKKKKGAELLRGKFGRFAHDKVFIVSNSKGAVKVLTGSTNFSITGIYVNSNHIIIFKNNTVAEKYKEVFEASLTGKASKTFNKSPLAAAPFPIKVKGTPETEITFSPHQEAFAQKILDDVAARVKKEGKKKDGSVLFAVMELAKGTGPVFPELKSLHANQGIFSFGISDTTEGIALYAPGKKTGVLVTGKPGKTQLPPPFDQVPGVGLGHQVHHKFIVCGFNTKDAVVYCGSSNLALGGEKENGDNLIAIHDQDVATVFALEALGLVDHFQFLNSAAKKAGKKMSKPKTGSKTQLAMDSGFFLSTTDTWVGPYYDSNDLHFVDRELFGA